LWLLRAIDVSGQLWCWGSDGSTESTAGGPLFVPHLVGDGHDWLKVASGGATCALNASGELWCWGYNSFGDVGDGTTDSRTQPVRVGDFASWADVDAGMSHACAISDSAELFCWGSNFFGQLGSGTPWFSEPQRVLPAP